jgi:hypothetical protein
VLLFVLMLHRSGRTQQDVHRPMSANTDSTHTHHVNTSSVYLQRTQYVKMHGWSNMNAICKSIAPASLHNNGLVFELC